MPTCSAFASFISRVNAAAHGGFRYDLENVARVARLSGACRTADGCRPVRRSSLAGLFAEARPHPRQVLRGAGMHDIPAPTRPASVIRLTTLNRRTAAFGQPAR